MKVRSLFLLGIACLALGAWAAEFQPVGFESISMGGAGVAFARGALAGYYNPALLANSNNLYDGVISFGMGAREYNLSDSIDQLAKDDIGTTLANINAKASAGQPPSAADLAKFKDIKAVLTKMGNQDNTLALMPGGVVAAQVSNIGIGVYGTSDSAVVGVVDPARTDLILKYVSGATTYYAKYDVTQVNPTPTLTTQADYEAHSLEYAISTGKTRMDVKGLAIVEVPISYARRLPIKKLPGTLALGVSAKAMRGYAYKGSTKIDTASDDVSDIFDNYKKESTTFGVDAGLLYKPPILRNFSFGVVAKNLNKPKFDQPGGGEMEVKPLVRAGVAMSLTRLFDFAADVDVTKNDRFDGTVAQYVGAGVRVRTLGPLAILVGARKNLQDKDETEGIIYTAGIGLGIKLLQFNVSAEAASKGGSYKGNEIPRYGVVNAAFVTRF
jgi:hypothetical protein